MKLSLEQAILFNEEKKWGVEWIKNRTAKCGAQGFCLENRKAEQLVIKSSVGRANGSDDNRWGCIGFSEFSKLIEKNRGIYEVLEMEREKRVFFDVDAKVDCLEQVCDVIREVFGVDKNGLSISGGAGVKNGEPFFSYHIILNNIFFIGEENAALLKIFALKHKHFNVDELVYGNNRCMKCPNQTKPNSDRVQAIILGDLESNRITLKKSEVSQMQKLDNNQIFMQWIAANAECNSENKKSGLTLLDIDLSDIKPLPTPLNFHFEDAMPLDLLAMIPSDKCNYSIWVRVGLWAKSCNIDFKDFWKWCALYDNSQKAFLNAKNLYENADFYSGSFSFMRDLFKSFYPEAELNSTFRRFKESFNLNGEELGEYRDLTLKDVNDIFNSQKSLILNAPMGTRKTGLMIDWIKQKKFKSVLLISARITLSHNVKSRMEKEGLKFANYQQFTKKQKENGELLNEKFLICSLESIHYLNGAKFECIIIDEMETILNTLNREIGTHKFLEANWDVFQQLLTATKRIMAMDAFTSKITVDFLKHFGSYRIFNMNAKPEIRECVFYDFKQADNWELKILKDIKGGKKLFVFHPVKKQAEKLRHIIMMGADLTEKQVLFYNGDSQNKQDLLNVNDKWGREEVKCVIATSCITVGVNFDVPACFNCTYAHYCSFIGARDFTQALMRIRAPKEKQIYILMERKLSSADFIKRDEMPKDSIFMELRQNLLLENNARQYKETLPFFLQKSGMILRENKNFKKIGEDAKATLSNLRESFKSSFEWDNIDSINSKKFYELEMKQMQNTANFMEVLQLRKHHFKMNMTEEEWKQDDREGWREGILKFLWDSGNTDFLCKLRKMKELKEDSLSFRILKENGLIIEKQETWRLKTLYSEDTKEVYMLPTTSANASEIQQEFHFHDSLKSANKKILAFKSINAIGGLDVLKIPSDEKRAKMTNERARKYIVNKKWDFLAAASYLSLNAE